ncbi:MAG: hypothetical protein Q8L55_05205 [Phycisphaerales bacterium]|nr:hypothetical protein [Phycisphaerales bacterium]
MTRASIAAAITLATVLIGGCASQDASALAGARVPADRYASTFQAARDVLREFRYAEDRIDAQQGVITSMPRSQPGIAKPWEARSGAAAAWEDLVNYQQRTVRISFITGEPGERAPGGRVIAATDPDRDLAAQPQETTLLVRVVVERFERDGRRVSADSVRVGRRAVNPVLEQGQWARALVQVQDDTVLASDLLRAIVARGGAPSPDAPTPAP